MAKDTITKLTEEVFWAKNIKRLVKKSRPIVICNECVFYSANTASCGLKHRRGVLWCSDCIFIKMDGTLFFKEETDVSRE